MRFGSLPLSAHDVFWRVVNGVSNSDWGRDATAPNGPPWTCRTSEQADITPAIQMLLAGDDGPADASQVADFLGILAKRNIAISDLWVVEDHGKLLWSALPMPSAGRTLLLLGSPTRFAGRNQAAVSDCIRAMCVHYTRRDLHLAQTLLDPGDTLAIEAYTRAGFRRMAELIYLQRTIRRPTPPEPLPAGWSLETYTEANHADFAEALLRSYEDSLDCPLLNGVRPIEDVITGHRATGEFDPADWLLLRHGNDPVGVLLMSRTSTRDGMEIVYLGVAPAARGKGFGDRLMQIATTRVAARKLNRLSLAVDTGNVPALSLYYRHGLTRLTSKVALMRDLTRT